WFGGIRLGSIARGSAGISPSGRGPLLVGPQRLLKTGPIPGEGPLRSGDPHQEQKYQGIKRQRIMQVVIEPLPVGAPSDRKPLPPISQLLRKPDYQAGQHAQGKQDRGRSGNIASQGSIGQIPNQGLFNPIQQEPPMQA